MGLLNLISLLGMVGLCAIAWLFSENRRPKYFPWRVVLAGILLQLILGALVFWFPLTRDILQVFSGLLNVVFDAADAGARFVFGRNLVPVPGQEPLLLSPLAPGAAACTPPSGLVVPGFCGIQLGYVFAFRALPAVIFFSGLISLLYNLGIMQAITNFFAKVFYSTMRLSGAESLSGAANIFVGIEAAIAVKPFLASMTRSELCAILSCCFGTAASSTLAIYVSFLKPEFPNILGHLVSASIMAIPACFLLSKILVPETTIPVTAGGIPDDSVLVDSGDPANKAAREADYEDDIPRETVAGEPIQRVSPMDAAIVGALDGVKMAVSIAAVLILILGIVYLINQLFGWLATLPYGVGDFFTVVTLQNILGALFLPLTVLTGVSLEWNELWESSVIIGRRLFETAIPPYQSLALAAARPDNPLSDRAVLIISYALSGFAHLASVGIFVGGTSALIPSRRRDISELGWKALFIGTLATLMIACVAGVFYLPGNNASILGEPVAPQVAPSPSAVPVPSASPTPEATVTPNRTAPAGSTSSPSPVSPASPNRTRTPGASPSASPEDGSVGMLNLAPVAFAPSLR
ncbi:MULTISPECIES: nucleoside transporter C-terminal domain-containing protein [unclassified Leptolyngbya]|uniref:nucleoside transporter C-terminal domain-containing protein n=1 Tax=unclassified Leptolyngbya TaxID=2650499 RepID=UPI001683899C|nr:nucleoside:proton symporter [Leptolyngbya sp. FACHB-8]MBD2154457.1 nucleoside:proton symporter [Leptolyngbya sp. FACHB-16]